MREQPIEKSITEYRLPQSASLEQQVLADAVASPEVIGEMMHYIDTDSFTSGDRRSIWNAVADAYVKGQTVDMVTMMERCGDPFVAEVITSGKTGDLPRTAMAHALLLRDAATRRRAYFAAVGLLDASVRSDKTGDDLCAIAEDASKAVQGRSSLASEKPLAEVLDNIAQAMKERREMAQSGQLYRIPTGFDTLDWNTYKGWGPGQLIVLAARPSVGKTAIMLKFARAAAEAGFPAQIFSLEMTDEELGQRMLYGTGKVTPPEVISGFVQDGPFREAVDALKGLPVYINDHSRSAAEIVTRMTVNARQGRCKIGFVDYLGLMDYGDRKGETSNQAIGRITGELKATAKRLRIPIILLCQLSRGSAKEHRAPELFDLRDSGNIEQDADIVMMLEQDTTINPDTDMRNINIWLRKNRNYKKDVCIAVAPNRSYSEFLEIGQLEDADDEEEQKEATLF